jgi:hypothetical protein
VLLKVPGAVIAVALNDIFYYSVVSYGLHQEGLGCLGQDLKITGLLVMLLFAIMMARGAWGLGLPIDGIWQFL